MAKSIYGTNGWDRVDIYADLCPGAVRGFQKGGGEISNVVVFKKILKNRPSRVHFQTTFCEKGGGEIS